ncbi:DUF6702 family protein [Psychrobium sp. 1_MG-2023]|uniref:DUF6702 family protein n=1 Tax=Psychrobium sp. 1_MG-2023 TaxID=3062624 RepID=UPI000C34DCEF|nr:DUF6702 family protein [Psychrobium sp. 1_MG-2023]MDP2561174.1 hypothetical protein [Psychrobium sp. 1_MG-2023]PKF55146.1 hypothetical protein CW748_14390 [Alteromonadales bacterium alter-6D02]
MFKSLLFLITVVCLSTPSVTFAHQQKAAETTVLFNKNSGQLEVAHRFYLHDTEHAVQSLFDKHADILDSKKTQQQFANYVAKQFLVHTLSNKALPLASVGYEVEGKFFWVYQETAIPNTLNGVKLFNGALRELWPTQINMVNIEGKGKVRTLYFSENRDWLITRF